MKKLFAGLLLLFAFHAVAEQELLEPNKAFAFSAEVRDGKIHAQWNVADGYYIYRNKLRFSTDTPGVRLGEPQFPKGKIKQDEFFGQVEIYRGTVDVTLPIKSGSGTLELTAHSQGCADIGVCYPPHKQTVNLQLAALDAGTDGSGTLQELSSLNNDLGLGGQDDVLPPDQAFRFTTELIDPNTVRASWSIAPDHYLYRDKFQFTVKQGNAKLGRFELPAGETKKDEFFGVIQVFHDEMSVDIPLLRGSKQAGEIKLGFVYQGCAEKTGICYPPIRKTETLLLPVTDTLLSGPAQTQPERESVGQLPPLSEQDSIAASLKKGGVLVVLTFFGFGLLLAFTPCVFPMIPILSSIIVGQGDQITTHRAFRMSVVYVLAMAITYTIAGVIAGMVGENLQAAFQNPWIIGSFAAIFVALSLSMFGFYELQMPNFIQSKLTEVSNRQKSGSLTGVAIMGFLSALIVGPCVAAPLAGALIYIGQTGDAVLGGIALFALSFGMGLPLIAIGTSAGKLLPRAGGWMDTVKAIFGVLLLAVAIWMLERVIPENVAMWLWAALFIISGIFMKALEPLSGESTGWARLWKGLGIILLIYGVMLAIGASAGGNDKFRPLHGVFGDAAVTEQHLSFQRIKGVDDLEREVAAARATGKPVMLDFYADWCIYCKDYEKYVFTDSRVQQRLSNFVLLQADVTANDRQDKTLLEKFGLTAPPAILFFDPSGQEQRGYRLVGSMSADDFLAHLNRMPF